MSFAPKLILDLSGLTFSLPLLAPLEFGSLAVIGVVLVSSSDSSWLRTLYCCCSGQPDFQHFVCFLASLGFWVHVDLLYSTGFSFFFFFTLKHSCPLIEDYAVQVGGGGGDGCSVARRI